MKVAVFHELPFGGARRVIGEFGKRLKKDHCVDLFYVDEGRDRDVASFFDDTFFYPFTPKIWRGGNWKVRVYKDTLELLYLCRLHKQIAAVIDKRNYDIVFVHPSRFTQAPFLLTCLKTPTLYFCQEPLRIVYDSFLAVPKNLSLLKRIYEQTTRRLRAFIDATNLKGADFLVVNSHFSKSWVRRVYRREAYMCYLGVDTHVFRPLRRKKLHDVLFLGEEVAVEGFDLLRESESFFLEKPNIQVIARGGNGVGIQDEELVVAYNQAKVVVSLSRNEPFGLIPLEAMACGVPVVAVAEGGLRESIIDGETGFLIRRNPREFHRVIEGLLSNERLRVKIGRQGRVHVMYNWTWEKSYATIVGILEKCVSKK